MRWLPSLLIAAVVALLMAWSVLPDPTGRLIGHPDTPGLDHLWGLWVTADGLWTHGPLLRDTPGANFPHGFRALQYEAANLLLFLPGFWLGGGGAAGAALGWNLLHAGAPLVGALGCWLLGRDLVGPEPAIAVLVAVFAASPFLLAHPAMGHSEYLPVMLWPWQIWLLRRWLRGGPVGLALLSGLLLGCMAATASYLPVFLALLSVPLAVGLVIGQPPAQRRWLHLLPVALVALVLVLAFGWALSLPWPRGHGAFAGQATAGLRPAPALESVLAGMLRLWPGEPLTDMNEQAAYPGLVALALGLLGAVRVRAARGWLALALVAFLLGAGPAVQAGETRLLLPAGLLTQLLPPLGLVHWWQRMAPVAALPLGVAALHGAHQLTRRLPWPGLVALLLAGGALADQATWPRGAVLPAPTMSMAPPSGLQPLLAQAAPGALLQVPLPIINLPGRPVSTGPYLAWQAAHGRAVSTRQALVGDSTLQHSYLARAVANRQAHPGGGARGGSLVGVGPLSATERRCALADGAALHDQGFAAVVLYTDQAGAEAVARLLDDLLGEPAVDLGVRLYSLDQLDPGEACDLPRPARVVASVLRLAG